MTSVRRIGHELSADPEETIRIGLTEAEAQTLGLILECVAGPNGKGGPASRRVHASRLLAGLEGVGVLTLVTNVAAGLVTFPADDNFDKALTLEDEGVTLL